MGEQFVVVKTLASAIKQSQKSESKIERNTDLNLMQFTENHSYACEYYGIVGMLELRQDTFKYTFGLRSTCALIRRQTVEDSHFPPPTTKNQKSGLKRIDMVSYSVHASSEVKTPESRLESIICAQLPC